MMMNREVLNLLHNRSQHCSNCGKYGHVNRACKEPVTSLGVICVRFEKEDDANEFQKRIIREKNINVLKHNTRNNRFLSYFAEYNERVKFLLIRRRHSLGLLEFVRGRYDVNDYSGITKLFRLMSRSEIEMLKGKEFSDIWNSIWSKGNAYNRQFDDEYQTSYEKFNSLASGYQKENILGLSYYTTNISPEWDTPEWGFPKGRRAFHERNLDCALREFHEETGYNDVDHTAFDNITPLKEVFRGTNDVMYKHVYYVSVLSNTSKMGFIDDSNKEIGDIGWFKYSDAVKMFRPYHQEKKKVLNDTFKFIVGVLEEGRIPSDEINPV